MNKILANVHNNKHLIRFILIRVIYFNPLAPMLQIRIILNAFQFTLLYKNNITFLFVISFNFDFHIILSVSSTKDKITGIFYKLRFCYFLIVYHNFRMENFLFYAFVKLSETAPTNTLRKRGDF
jgi:uncharacterized integral membrane protein